MTETKGENNMNTGSTEFIDKIKKNFEHPVFEDIFEKRFEDEIRPCGARYGQSLIQSENKGYKVPPHVKVLTQKKYKKNRKHH